MKLMKYIPILLLFLLISCSDDERKLTYSSDSVYTGEVLDITSNSAVINGYFSFFGEVNDFLAGNDYSALQDSIVIPKTDINKIREQFHISEQIDVTDAPDTLIFTFAAYDVEFLSAGFCYSLFHDFHDITYVVSSATKIKHFSFTLEGLTPATQYFYRTVVIFHPIIKLECPALHKTFAPIYTGDDYDYYVYGMTKSFTTKP